MCFATLARWIDSIRLINRTYGLGDCHNVVVAENATTTQHVIKNVKIEACALRHIFGAGGQKEDNFGALKKPSSWCLATWLVLLVIRLGLEPRTPTLKVLCSTSWASESPTLVWRSSLKKQCKVTRFLFSLQIFLHIFYKIFCAYLHPLSLNC